jgi:hypothetical protein
MRCEQSRYRALCFFCKARSRTAKSIDSTLTGGNDFAIQPFKLASPFFSLFVVSRAIAATSVGCGGVSDVLFGFIFNRVNGKRKRAFCRKQIECKLSLDGKNIRRKFSGSPGFVSIARYQNLVIPNGFT